MKNINEVLSKNSSSPKDTGAKLIVSATNSSFNNNEDLVELNTVADNNCLFHAIFATNINDAVCRYNFVEEKRAELADAIEKCKYGDKIYQLVKALLLEVIMSNENNSHKKSNTALSQAIQEYYTLKETHYAKLLEMWSKIEALLLTHKLLLDHINSSIVSNESKDLKSRLNDCVMSTNQDIANETKKLINQMPELQQLHSDYNDFANMDINFDIEKYMLQGKVLTDYAAIIRGNNWLLPIEANIISIINNITIEYYSNNQGVLEKIETYNPGQKEVVKICFNGVNHYQKIILRSQLSKLNFASSNVIQNKNEIELQSSKAMIFSALNKKKIEEIYDASVENNQNASDVETKKKSGLDLEQNENNILENVLVRMQEKKFDASDEELFINQSISTNIKEKQANLSKIFEILKENKKIHLIKSLDIGYIALGDFKYQLLDFEKLQTINFRNCGLVIQPAFPSNVRFIELANNKLTYFNSDNLSSILWLNLIDNPLSLSSIQELRRKYNTLQDPRVLLSYKNLNGSLFCDDLAKKDLYVLLNLFYKKVNEVNLISDIILNRKSINDLEDLNLIPVSSLENNNVEKIYTLTSRNEEIQQTTQCMDFVEQQFKKKKFDIDHNLKPFDIFSKHKIVNINSTQLIDKYDILIQDIRLIVGFIDAKLDILDNIEIKNLEERLIVDSYLHSKLKAAIYCIEGYIGIEDNRNLNYFKNLKISHNLEQKYWLPDYSFLSRYISPQQALGTFKNGNSSLLLPMSLLVPMIHEFWGHDLVSCNNYLLREEKKKFKIRKASCLKNLLNEGDEKSDYIYVVSPKGGLYIVSGTSFNYSNIRAGQHISGRSFNHSNIRAGQPVACAGELKLDNEEGLIKEINNYSGHYRPGKINLFLTSLHLHSKGFMSRKAKLSYAESIEDPISIEDLLMDIENQTKVYIPEELLPLAKKILGDMSSHPNETVNSNSSKKMKI